MIRQPGKPVETYPLELALEYAAGIIEVHGYTSKKDSSQSGKYSTSDTLKSWLTGSAAPVVTQEAGVKAQEALAWLNALSPNTRESDFDVSMRKLAHGGYRNLTPGLICKSDFGFVACIYSTIERSANREKNKEVAKEAASTSNYMGLIKQREEFFIKLISKKYSDNIGCYIYKVKDRKGNLGVFFSSDSDLANVDECFLAKMTPKRHGVNNYHGGKETIFNRVKVVQNVGSPKEAAVAHA